MGGGGVKTDAQASPGLLTFTGPVQQYMSQKTETHNLVVHSRTKKNELSS